eukprot:scaffold7761_cov417-Prasinococcus_capsulatus_cf.AAC.1
MCRYRSRLPSAWHEAALNTGTTQLSRMGIPEARVPVRRQRSGWPVEYCPTASQVPRPRMVWYRWALQ